MDMTYAEMVQKIVEWKASGMFMFESPLKSGVSMNKSIYSRYQLSEDGQIIIDISIRRLEDLYHNYDLSAPYPMKELNAEFVDYIIECVREIEKKDFLIRLSCIEKPGENGEERVRKSIRNFFEYMQLLEKRKISHLFRTSAMLFAVGLLILFISIWFNGKIGISSDVAIKVVGEGLTIAAWVSLWEALATFLVQWPPSWKDLSLYRRIAGAPVNIRQISLPVQAK